MGTEPAADGGNELPDSEHPFADSDTDLLQALLGIDEETAEALSNLSGEEARKLFTELQAQLEKMAKALTQSFQGDMDDKELLAGLRALMAGKGPEGEEPRAGADDIESLAAALASRFLGLDDSKSSGAAGDKGEGMVLDLSALMQRLERGDVAPETRQAIEGAIRRADDGSGGRQWQQALLAGLQAAKGEPNEALKPIDAGKGFALKTVSVEMAAANSANGNQGEASARALIQSLGGAQSGQSGMGSGMHNGAGGSLASQLAGAASSAASPLTTSIHSSGWGDSLSERVVFMANNSVQSANVRLNPQNMGPLEIRIQMQNDQATVNFNVHNATTREAVEQALPRLREMLESQGIDLADVDVSGEQPRFAQTMEGEAGADGSGAEGDSGGDGGAGDDAAGEEMTVLGRSGETGLVDLYA